MALRNLEAAILAELKRVAKNSKIRQKDIVEWSTGMVKAQEGETYFHLPEMGVHVCVVLPAKKAAQHGLHPTSETLPDLPALSTPEHSATSQGES